MYHLKTPIASISDTFYMAAGSVTGRRHVGSGNLLSGKNNQDSYSCCLVDDYIVMSVHDGCGSAPFSEFGARFAASITPLVVAAAMKKRGCADIDSEEFFEILKVEYLSRLSLVANVCTDSFASKFEWGDLGSSGQATNSFLSFVRNHLLFTVIGAIVTPLKTVVFGIGDGVYCINGEVSKIGPFIDNAPDYLSKALLEPKLSPPFALFRSLKTSELESLAIGTDGLGDLIESVGKNIPGKSRRVGGMDEVFSQVCLFSSINSFQENAFESLTGWLRLINSEVVKIASDEDGCTVLLREEGLLPDDTTLVAMRRVEEN